MDWNAIENLIQTQIVAASGLAGDHVVWDHQNRDRPTTPFLALRVEESDTLAHHTAEQTVIDNPTPTAGNEILLGVKKTAEFRVWLTLMTQATTGSLSAYGRLATIRTTLETEPIQAAFFAAGLALFELGSIQSIPRVLETQFEGRATLALKFRAADLVEVSTTFIESAEWVSTITT